MKKTLWILILTLITGFNVQAGMVVGRDKIDIIQDNYTDRLNIKDPIVLTKPDNKNKIQLVSYEDFLKQSEVNKAVDVVSPKEVKKDFISEEEKLEAIKGQPIFAAVSSAKEVVEEVKDEEVAPAEALVKKAPVMTTEKVKKEAPAEVHTPIKDLNIYYDLSMKTFLSKDDKEKLKEIVNFATDNNLRINILTSASGDAKMAERVSLLRANIIKSALRGYGLADDKMQVKSLGNSINEDVAKVFLVK